MIGYIYYHKSPTNKYYVGRTLQKPQNRWRKGKGYKNQNIWVDIQKFGWNSFEHHILEQISSNDFDELVKILNTKEQEWIVKLGANITGYNLTSGGTKGTTFLIQVKDKMSIARVGRKPRLGIKATQEQKKHLSELRKGAYRKGCRKVVNNNTGEIYNSIREAARKCGLNRDTVWKICIGKFRRRDFSYYKEVV